MLRTSVVVALFLLAGCFDDPAAQQTAPSCVVSHISDGDTFRCQDGRRVRLIGIDSPEAGQRPFGPAARRALEERLPAKTRVRLETDVTPLDRYGRVLAYVWLGPTLLNELMVRNGWALLYTVPPNVRYADRLAQAQKEARADGAGLWSQGGFDCLPSQFRRDHCVNRP